MDDTTKGKWTPIRYIKAGYILFSRKYKNGDRYGQSTLFDCVFGNVNVNGGLLCYIEERPMNLPEHLSRQAFYILPTKKQPDVFYPPK